MTFVPSDQDVRDSIRRDIDINVCVEAGAGTGKTTVLVDRIVEMLRRGPARVDQLAVITFTEKAAAELATRVRQGLERALGDAAGEERERIVAALRGLNHAHIETIHAFAAGLLRERPIEAGMEPAFDVLDVLPAQLAFDRAWDDWLNEQLAAEPPPPALLEAMNLGLDFKRVREAAELLDRHRDALPLAPYTRIDIDVDALIVRVKAALDDLLAVQDRIIDEANRTYQQIADVQELHRQLLSLRGRQDALLRLIASAPLPDTFKGSQNDWNPPSAGKRAKDALKEVRGAIEDAREALRSNATAALAEWLQGFVAYFFEQRRAAGVADFDDLLLCARALVRNEEVRRYFAEKYCHILVDEFQDTDPLQAELVVRLCAAEDPREDWRAARLRPGSLFVVGDPKQSIYRFRRADITMYDDVRRRIFGDDVRVIVQNFRSVPGIIDWVNGAFEKLISEDPGIQPRYIGLAARADLEGAGGVEVITGVPEQPTAQGIRRAEADAIAARIAAGVRNGEWTVRDGEGNVVPATWRDVAVLIPARAELYWYEDALARAEIPYRHEGGRTFFQRQEVRELIALLRAIDDASDAVACVAALRSAAFGCSDEELFLWRAAGGRFDYFAVRDDAEGPVAGALRELRALARERYTRSLPELVRRVLERTRLVELAMLQPQGDQVGANLLKVIDLARAFEESESAGLRGFVQWLKENIVREAAETDASISEETDDVVRVVTVHAAKGLEFPIVVFANMGTERADTTNVIVNRSGSGPSLHLKLGAKDDGFVTPGFEAAHALEEQHRAAEEARVLYVAATRARDRLVVPLFSAPEKGGSRERKKRVALNDLLRRAGVDAGETIDAASIPRIDTGVRVWRREPAAGATAGDVLDARETWVAASGELRAHAGAGLIVHTASSLKAEDEQPWRHGPEDVRRGRATDFGVAVHAVLERIDLRRPDGLAALASAVAREFGLTGRADEIERVARNAITHEVVQRALASRVTLREVAFTAPLPSVDGLAEGRIDMLFEDGGAITIVDFKTDAVRESELDERAAHYRRQALVYAWAAARTTGMPVREVVFLFARLPATRAFAADAGFMAEAEALLAAAPVA